MNDSFELLRRLLIGPLFRNDLKYTTIEQVKYIRAAGLDGKPLAAEGNACEIAVVVCFEADVQRNQITFDVGLRDRLSLGHLNREITFFLDAPRQGHAPNRNENSVSH